MGCDIHLAVERRTADGWERAEPMVPRRYKGCEGEQPTERDRWYNGRNYPLFAILAGVRNGYGFAGTDWGDPVEPIDEPRELPDDVSAETAQWSEVWGIDGHSHSWLTLAELLAFDWDRQLTRRCWVRRKRALPNHLGETDDRFAERLQEAAQVLGGLPSAESWGYETCGMSSEGQGPSGWRTIQWTEPFWSAAGMEWWGLVARMARLANGDPSSVRIVFWFDN